MQRDGRSRKHERDDRQEVERYRKPDDQRRYDARRYTTDVSIHLGLKRTFPITYTQVKTFSNIRVVIEIDLIHTGTEKESTDKDTMTQETIGEDMKMNITIMTVLATGNKIADEMRDEMRERTFPPPHTTKSLHVEKTLQSG